MKQRALLTALSLLLAVFCAGVRAPQAASRVQSASLEEIDALLFKRPGPAVIVGMASWCGPCKEELPDLLAVYAALKDKGLRLYGLSIDFEGPEPMQDVADAYGVDFPVIWGGEDAMRQYALFPIPMMLFVRDGRIVERISGKSSRQELEKRLAAFLP